MERTYKVVRLVASSPVSWEDAARRGIDEASKTIVDLSHARVTQMEALVAQGGVTAYRLELEVAFQLDRSRRSDSGSKETVTRHLIVANKTLVREHIPRLVAERMESGHPEFHLVIPASRSRQTRRLIALAGDPMSGYTPVDVDGLRAAKARDRREAEQRMASFVGRLDDLGATYTAEVGDPDPFRAVSRVMSRSTFDEIIVSTFAAPVSRWLRLDLPSRLERAFHIPVVTILINEQDDDPSPSSVEESSPG